MLRTLPPLETFRFFEAAARHLNFTHAAKEMHVTHGAVSQRIKRLEEDPGTGAGRHRRDHRRGRGDSAKQYGEHPDDQYAAVLGCLLVAAAPRGLQRASSGHTSEYPGDGVADGFH